MGGEGLRAFFLSLCPPFPSLSGGFSPHGLYLNGASTVESRTRPLSSVLFVAALYTWTRWLAVVATFGRNPAPADHATTPERNNSGSPRSPALITPASFLPPKHDKMGSIYLRCLAKRHGISVLRDTRTNCKAKKNSGIGSVRC